MDIKPGVLDESFNPKDSDGEAGRPTAEEGFKKVLIPNLQEALSRKPVAAFIAPYLPRNQLHYGVGVSVVGVFNVYRAFEEPIEPGHMLFVSLKEQEVLGGSSYITTVHLSRTHASIAGLAFTAGNSPITGIGPSAYNYPLANNDADVEAVWKSEELLTKRVIEIFTEMLASITPVQERTDQPTPPLRSLKHIKESPVKQKLVKETPPKEDLNISKMNKEELRVLLFKAESVLRLKRIEGVRAAVKERAGEKRLEDDRSVRYEYDRLLEELSIGRHVFIDDLLDRLETRLDICI